MATGITLADLVTDSALRKLAGERSYARGIGYFRSEAVSRLRATDREITAEVVGSEVYRARLWIDGQTLDWDCTCPVGQDGDFCKHLVASGLTWIARGSTGGGEKKVPDDLKAIRSFLESTEKATLVDLLLRQAEWDESLAADLLTQAQKAGMSGARAVKETIRKAFPRDGFVDYYGMHGVHARAAPVVDLLRGLLRQDPATALELAGYAAKLGLRTLDNADDSDGLMGDLVGAIAAVHREAASHTGVAPSDLARTVFELQMTDGYGFFQFEGYSDALGKEGLIAFRKLAERAWKDLPELNPGSRDQDETGDRAQLTEIMKQLARREGDVDALVAVLGRDLSKSWVYLDIAEALAAAGRHDEALAWAERGHQAFPHELHYPLEEFLVQEYHRRGRHDDAVAIRWARFLSHPSLDGYQSLKRSADRAKGWKEWREKAFARLRDAENDKRDRHAPDVHGLRGSGLLVQIFLWEGNPEVALAQARSGGCPMQLWVTLAKALETTQPDEAVAIYQAQIDPIVQRTNNHAYDEAVALLARVCDLMAASNRSAELAEHVTALRTRHKAKRNFVQRLDALVAERGGSDPPQRRK